MLFSVRFFPKKYYLHPKEYLYKIREKIPFFIMTCFFFQALKNAYLLCCLLLTPTPFLGCHFPVLSFFWAVNFLGCHFVGLEFCWGVILLSSFFSSVIFQVKNRPFYAFLAKINWNFFLSYFFILIKITQVVGFINFCLHFL